MTTLSTPPSHLLSTVAPQPTVRRPTTFADELAEHGSAAALIDGRSTTTYRELAARVEALAASLAPTRRLVAVEMANTVDAVVAYLAALRGGHVALVVPAGSDIGDRYGADVVFSAANGWSVDERRPGAAHALHPDVAMLLSTSGSTGSPKLVRLSHTNVQSNAEAIVSYLGIGADDRASTTLPLHYCYGLSVLNSHLAVGASVVLTDLSVATECFWSLFDDAGATSFAGVPHTFDLLDRTGFADRHVPTLRTVTQAGGRLDPEAVRRYARLGADRGWRFFVMYGQTEATARMAYLPPEHAASAPTAIGVPIPGGSFRIDAAALDDVEAGLGVRSDDGDSAAGEAASGGEDGIVGELVYRGPNVMMGYAECPDDLSRGPELDELRTGDLARLRADGLYEIVGRRSRFVKPFGVRVDLDRLEAALRDAGIDSVCAGDDDRIAIGVVGAEAEAAAAASHATELLGLPASRVHAVALDAVPHLPNGKTDYRAIRDAAAAASSDAQANGDGVIDEVRACFAAVLGRAVGDDDTFAGLGGDSLSYVEVSIRLEELLGDLPADWPSMPVSTLAAVAPRSGGGVERPTSAARGPRARQRRWTARMETGVVLRAVGIVLIVGGHTDVWEIPGAAHILLAVAGCNFARFQLNRGTNGPRAMSKSIARVAVPSVIWIGAVAALTQPWTWRHALFVNAQLGDRGARWGYWYVEALVQVLVVLALLFAVPAVRRFERRRPFATAGAALAAGLAVRFDLLPIPGMHHAIMRSHEVLWLFALGWASARARTTAQRALVSVAAVAAVPGFFGMGHRDAAVLAGLLALIWVPTLPVPRMVTGALGTVAGASLYIYLTHWQVLAYIEHLQWPATIASVGVGVFAAAAATRITAVAPRLVRALRSMRPGRAVRRRTHTARRRPPALAGR